MLFVFNSSIFHNESFDLSNDISQFLDLADFQKKGNFVNFYRKFNSNGNHVFYMKPQIQKLAHWRNGRIRDGKYSNWKQTTLYLCFLDIILTLPSLPTHSSRGKVRLKTRGFSKFWEFPLFSIGNPIVMKIKVFSMENQHIFMKISLKIWL